jgi:heme oxygenase (mycobilin-producing)
MGIVRVNKFVAASGRENDAFEFLKSVQEYISTSTGCESCLVLRGIEDSASILVIEEWASKEFHLESLQNYPKEKMTAAMELFGAPPQGSYYTK